MLSIEEKTKKIVEEIGQGKRLSEIARDHGVSRQRVHQIKTRIGKVKVIKPKKLTKKELEAQLKAEAKEKAKLQEEIDELKQKEWKEHLSIAFENVKEILHNAFGGLVTLLRFEHVDGSGYWFSFELINDRTRQSYRVGHDEINKVDNGGLKNGKFQ